MLRSFGRGFKSPHSVDAKQQAISAQMIYAVLAVLRNHFHFIRDNETKGI